MNLAIHQARSASRPSYRLSRPRSPAGQSTAAPWLGSPEVDVLGFCLGGLADDAVDSSAVGLLRSQRQPELPTHHAGQEAADRMLLPAGRLHDCGDRYTLGVSEQAEYGRLLGPAAGRTRASFPTLRSLFREALGVG